MTTLVGWREQTRLTKEPGTIAWLNRLRPGGSFVDIGANVGIYSEYAANLVGRDGRVYAIEPHIPNAAALMQRVARFDNVSVVVMALGGDCEFDSFNYSSVEPGSSGSQFGHSTSETGHNFKPVFTEWKRSVTLDELYIADVVEASRLVKIDVDGNELDILHGMRQFLKLGTESVQVEVRPTSKTDVLWLMRDSGYRLDHCHHTSNGLKAIQQGSDPESLSHNAVFVKA